MDKAANVHIKRIYEPSSPRDGYRILVDRLWPRGIKKEEAALDEWSKTLAPSSELRKSFGHKSERFEEFSARYRKELLQHRDALQHISVIAEERVVTLLYAAKDPDMNNAVVLYNTLKALKYI